MNNINHLQEVLEDLIASKEELIEEVFRIKQCIPELEELIEVYDSRIEAMNKAIEQSGLRLL